MFMKSKHNKNT